MEKYKEKLEAEKKLLEEELKTMGQLDQETGDWEATPDSLIKTQEVPDEGDMAERTEDYEGRSASLATLESRLNDINRALSLIEKGEYGLCEICHEKISEARLEANPSARTCELHMEK